MTVSRGESSSSSSRCILVCRASFPSALFKLSGRIFNYAGKIKVGRYSFQSGVSNREILYANQDRDFHCQSVGETIYEGLRGTLIAKILNGRWELIP